MSLNNGRVEKTKPISFLFQWNMVQRKASSENHVYLRIMYHGVQEETCIHKEKKSSATCSINRFNVPTDDFFLCCYIMATYLSLKEKKNYKYVIGLIEHDASFQFNRRKVLTIRRIFALLCPYTHTYELACVCVCVYLVIYCEFEKK